MAKSYILGSLVLSAMLALSACGGKDNAAGQPAAAPASAAPAAAAPAAATPAANIVRVATDASYSPFEFRDTNGKIIGFDVDVIEAAAQSQGLKVEVASYAWDSIFDRLDNNTADLVIGTINKTPDREAKYELSEEYAQSPDAVMVEAGSPIQKIEDLKDKTVGYLAGSVDDKSITELNIPIVAKPIPTLFLAARNLSSKRSEEHLDAVVGDELILRNLVAKSDNPKAFRVMTIEQQVGKSPVVFAAKKGNSELIAKINKGIAEIKANGTYDQIYKKWFDSGK